MELLSLMALTKRSRLMKPNALLYRIRKSSLPSSTVELSITFHHKSIKLKVILPSSSKRPCYRLASNVVLRKADMMRYTSPLHHPDRTVHSSTLWMIKLTSKGRLHLQGKEYTTYRLPSRKAAYSSTNLEKTISCFLRKLKQQKID